MQIILMAGGGGTRLWPLSRSRNPKQFLDLGSGKSLLEHTWDRAVQLAQADDIYVATTEDFVERIQEMLPSLPASNIFVERARRDTGPAVAAVALQLEQRGLADKPTAFMWSDHVFTQEDEFVSVMRKVPRLVEKHSDTIVIVGHHPTYAETNLGYIEGGEPVASEEGVYMVRAFKEKPDEKTAEAYVAAGNYFWNMAYISCRPSYLLQQLREHSPELMDSLRPYSEALRTGDFEAAGKAYEQVERVAIDYVLLEKTPRIIVATGDFGFTDVGSWRTVWDVFGTNGDHKPLGHHIHVDSQQNYIYNATDRVVSMIGVENTIVVVTEDAILVVDKDKSAYVKDVVKRLEEDNKTEHL